MTDLAYRDMKMMVNFLQELHSLDNLTSLASRVISILPKVIPSELTIWSPTSFPDGDISLSIASQKTGYLLPEDAKQLANQHFREHPFAMHYLKTHDGSAHTLSDFVSEQALHRIESLYYGMLRPAGIEEQMTTVLPVSALAKTTPSPAATEDIVVSLHRPERSFSERDRLVLNLLRPHLALAYRNAQAINNIQQELDQLNETTEAIGMITLNETGKAQQLTRRAWKLLTQYFTPSDKHTSELPENLQRWVNYQLNQLSSADFVSKPCLPLRVEHGNSQLVVRLIVDGKLSQYLLLLEERPAQQFSPESLELTGLTRRESQVLYQIAAGQRSAEIATFLQISEGTVRKHLEHIYEKFNVKTRTAAVMCALKMLGMIG